MIGIQDIGSEGFVVLSLYILIKDVVAPLVRKVTSKKSTPNDTIKRLNPNSVTLEGLAGILKGHVKYDDERTKEIRGDIKDLRKSLSECGERLAGLESRSQ